jgi:hypothetical protein
MKSDGHIVLQASRLQSDKFHERLGNHPEIGSASVLTDPLLGRVFDQPIRRQEERPRTPGATKRNWDGHSASQKRPLLLAALLSRVATLAFYALDNAGRAEYEAGATAMHEVLKAGNAFPPELVARLAGRGYRWGVSNGTWPCSGLPLPLGRRGASCLT